MFEFFTCIIKFLFVCLNKYMKISSKIPPTKYKTSAYTSKVNNWIYVNLTTICPDIISSTIHSPQLNKDFPKYLNPLWCVPPQNLNT